MLQRYYKILDLPTNASVEDVKRAYRRLALLYHPDRNQEPGAKERFIAITEAYNYLINPPKKKQTKTVQSAASYEAERVYKARMQARKAAAQRYREFKQQQEQEMGRAYSSALSFLIGVVFLVLAIYFGKNIFTKMYVNANPAEAIGWIVRMDHRHYWIEFQAKDGHYMGRFMGRRSKEYLLTPNGMPVVVHGQFLVKYRKNKPGWFYVEYNHFTPRTLRLYLEHTNEMILTNYHDTREAGAECLSLRVLDTFGIKGLANLIFMNESMMENHINNGVTFRRMASDEQYKNLLSECLIEEP